MNTEKQSPVSILADIEWNNASKTPAPRTTLNVPIVMFADFIGEPQPPIKPARIANWTGRVLSSPTRGRASNRTGRTVDRSAQNIADWSSYLPADCVAAMVSLGWDHTT
jgi:hypothetical protein